MATDYLSKIEQSLGFECQSLPLYSAPDNSTGFTQFIKQQQTCTDNTTGTIKSTADCQCDLGVAGFRVNEDRIGRVDFVAPFLYDGLAVLTHIDNTVGKSNAAFFLLAFTPTVWVTILGLIGAFTVLKLLDRRFLEDTPTPEVSTDLTDKKTSVYGRIRLFLMKQQHLWRLRKALQSVCKLIHLIKLSVCVLVYLKYLLTIDSLFAFGICEYNI